MSRNLGQNYGQSTGPQGPVKDKTLVSIVGVGGALIALVIGALVLFAAGVTATGTAFLSALHTLIQSVATAQPGSGVSLGGALQGAVIGVVVSFLRKTWWLPWDKETARASWVLELFSGALVGALLGLGLTWLGLLALPFFWGTDTLDPNTGMSAVFHVLGIAGGGGGGGGEGADGGLASFSALFAILISLLALLVIVGLFIGAVVAGGFGAVKQIVFGAARSAGEEALKEGLRESMKEDTKEDHKKSVPAAMKAGAADGVISGAISAAIGFHVAAIWPDLEDAPWFTVALIDLVVGAIASGLILLVMMGLGPKGEPE